MDIDLSILRSLEREKEISFDVLVEAIEQALDENSLGPLDGHSLYAQLHQRAAVVPVKTEDFHPEARRVFERVGHEPHPRRVGPLALGDIAQGAVAAVVAVVGDVQAADLRDSEADFEQ